METPVEKVAHDYFAALVAGDNAAWTALFAEDGVTNDPVGSPPVKGHDAILKFIEGIRAAFASLALYEREIISNGNDAAVKWEGIAVGKNGQTVVFSGIDVLSLDGTGKIKTVYAFWDPKPVLTAVGVEH